MSEIYYCPENPGEHVTFFGTATVTQDWLIDPQGLWLETNVECCDVLREPDAISVSCTECGTQAKHGIPPHALEQLARIAK